MCKGHSQYSRSYDATANRPNVYGATSDHVKIPLEIQPTFSMRAITHSDILSDNSNSCSTDLMDVVRAVYPNPFS